MDSSWHIITAWDDQITYRMRVYGGWVVRCDTWFNEEPNKNLATSMIFIKDPDHAWVI
jgi:hypothetical protein